MMFISQCWSTFYDVNGFLPDSVFEINMMSGKSTAVHLQLPLAYAFIDVLMVVYYVYHFSITTLKE